MTCPCGKCHCEVCGNQMTKDAYIASIQSELDALKRERDTLRDAYQVAADSSFKQAHDIMIKDVELAALKAERDAAREEMVQREFELSGKLAEARAVIQHYAKVGNFTVMKSYGSSVIYGMGHDQDEDCELLRKDRPMALGKRARHFLAQHPGKEEC